MSPPANETGKPSWGFFKAYAVGFFSVILILFVMARFSPKTQELRRALPQLRVEYSGGRLIEDDIVDGIGGAGAAEKRVYCTVAAVPDILSFFETELAKKGLARTPFGPSEYLPGLASYAIGQFERHPFKLRLYLMTKALGRTGPYCRLGERYLISVLEN
jgi:hypothetical protein